ncbi:hypothetical protein Q7P35_002152 [Cladosporium inversicolor]
MQHLVLGGVNPRLLRQYKFTFCVYYSHHWSPRVNFAISGPRQRLQLSSFVTATVSGGLRCHLQDLTLVAPVYNKLELTFRLEEKAADFADFDDDGQFAGLNFRDLTEEEVRQARLDLVVLQESCAAQVDMIRRQRDVTLLKQALSSLAAHGASLEMLRVEVEIYLDDTTTPLIQLFGGNWKPIWTSAANAGHTVLSCDELNNVDFASVRLGASLGHLKELSLRVSDRIVNWSSDEESLTQPTQVTDFQVVRSLLRTCPNILKLNLGHLSVKYNDDSLGILQALAESSLPYLHSLTLQGFSGITEEELLALLQGFETLQSLSLRYVRLRLGSFQRILDYCTMEANMRELDYSQAYQEVHLQVTQTPALLIGARRTMRQAVESNVTLVKAEVWTQVFMPSTPPAAPSKLSKPSSPTNQCSPLLAPAIEEADVYYKDIITRSNGEYKESRIDLKAHGLKVADFMDWWKNWMADLQTPGMKQKTFLETMVPAHPEHYALPPYPSGVVETIGEHIARVQIKPIFDPPAFVRAYGDPSYLPLSAIGTLDDGSILFYILQELRDCDEGSEFRLRLLFPAAAPQVFFDEHAEHLAVEFRSFVTSAFERQQRLLNDGK